MAALDLSARALTEQAKQRGQPFSSLPEQLTEKGSGPFMAPQTYCTVILSYLNRMPEVPAFVTGTQSVYVEMETADISQTANPTL